MVITDIQFEVRSFRFEEPMKIAFATIVDMQTCIIRVLTDAGITGYGEAAPFSYVTGDNLETVISVGTEMKKALIGVDPRALGKVHRIMDSMYAGNTAVKAGIDIACYDISAKAAGVPLYRFLGGDEPHVHSDVTIGIDEPARMAEAAKSVYDYMGHGERIIFINVMNNMSVDCDCVSTPAAVDMADIGIFASLDPVALDQACIDQVFAAQDGGSLQERILSKNGLHILKHAQEIGLGNRAYKLISLDEE